MNDRLNVPEELQHLIEKREQEDRRKQDTDAVPPQDVDSSDESDTNERRKVVRRKSDRES